MPMSSRDLSSIKRTGEWTTTQGIPTDVIIDVGDVEFPLHKLALVAKSGLLRRKIMASTASDLTTIIKVPAVPGGPEVFEKVVKFCYGADFEITLHNVVALQCAAEYLEMTDEYCDGNLVERTEEFLENTALNSLSNALTVLRSCEGLLPLAEELNIVQDCVHAVSLKACQESNFPTRSPPEWWAYEFAAVSPFFFQKIITSMRGRGATARTITIAVTAYAHKSLPDLLFPSSSTSPSPSSTLKTLIESLVTILPPELTFPLGFLCCLLRAAIFLDSSVSSRREIEKLIAAMLDQASVGDLLTISLDYSGEIIADLESLRRILAMFVEKEAREGNLYGSEDAICSASMQKVARTVDSYVGEIAMDEDLSVSKFTGIAGALPKSSRRFDDDLYRAVDIYLKAHPGLDEIEREKVCSVIDPLKLSYEARLHSKQNKRLPVQIVLQSLYYDQLKLRSGMDDTTVITGQMKDDASLAKENEALRSELTKMKMFISVMQKGHGSFGSTSSTTKSSFKKPKFFSSVSKTLGKLNPFRQWSKDTSNICDVVEVVKSRRRFSVS